MDEVEEKKTKINYVGAPAIFKLEIACQLDFQYAWESGGLYLVGSCLTSPNWRDIDLRLIMSDEKFKLRFPNANCENANWEHDPDWLITVISISEDLSKRTGLPIDFQIQPSTFVNKHHNKPRHAIGFKIKRED